jgi:outer membrane protein OmpA-like peptidoglycan-associated protein
VSNPGDRWRKSWMVGAVGVALVAALTLGRCAANDSRASSANFTAASVQADSAKFAAELPAGAEVVILRGTVTGKTAQALRARAKTLAEEAPGLTIDDQLTITANGVSFVEPEALLVALTRGLTRPAALRVNTDLGAELTGIAASDEDRNLVFNIVSGSLNDGAVIKNSVTVAPAGETSGDETSDEETGIGESDLTDVTEPQIDTSGAAVDTVTVPAPETTVPADTIPADTAAPTTIAVPETTIAVAVTEPTTTTTVAPSLEDNGTIALEGVQFDLGSARLTSESATVLDRLVKTLNDNPNLSIAISGHTDNSGDRGYNKTLSTARANSVMKYLTAAGIDAKRLSAQGFGDAKPRANNGTSAGRKQNRRIEVTAQ